MTPPERKALLFFAAVGVLGLGARAAGLGGPPAAVVSADEPGRERDALARQIAAVDSAREARRPARRPKASTRRTRGRSDPTPVELSSFPSPQRPAPSPRLDVDRADSAALEALPGVGPALAARIVADRAARGGFGSMRGLSRVPGIGPRLEARLGEVVTFSATP